MTVTPEEALKHFRKRWSDDAIGGIGMNIPPPPRIPSGVLEFDINSGGGWPAGNVSIVVGGKDTGKSNLLYTTAATYQENHPDQMVALLDMERNYDTPWGEQIGVDASRLLTLQPDYGEQAVDMVEYLIYETENVGLLIVDSLAQLVPIKEIEKSAEDAVPGGVGLLIARLCKKTAAALAKVEKLDRRPTIIYANQQRSKIAVRYGSPITMPGGNAPGYYASTMVNLYGGKEEVVADVDPGKPAIKHVQGTITKKKGPVVSTAFEYDIALLPHKGVRVGRSVNDWKIVAGYLTEWGELGRGENGKGWQILGHEFRLKNECRAWYEDNRPEVRDHLIQRLMASPDDI